MTELEMNVVTNWLKSGAIKVTDTGEENTYYIDQFDYRYYCKNYPDIDEGA